MPMMSVVMDVLSLEVPVGQVSRDAQLAIGFPAWSSEEGCGLGGGSFVGPLVPEFYIDVSLGSHLTVVTHQPNVP